jgi:hypothetical protein
LGGPGASPCASQPCRDYEHCSWDLNVGLTKLRCWPSYTGAHGRTLTIGRAVADLTAASSAHRVGRSESWPSFLTPG